MFLFFSKPDVEMHNERMEMTSDVIGDAMDDASEVSTISSGSSCKSHGETLRSPEPASSDGMGNVINAHSRCRKDSNCLNRL